MAMSRGSGPAQAVRSAIEPVVVAAGLHLEDVVIAPAGRRTAVRIVVDLGADAVGSLDLDTLGEVSQQISGELDRVDPVRGEYVLEVSTPGTDRPLTELRHFRRARTRLVRLNLRDGSVVVGRLVGAEADGLDLEPAGSAPGAVRRIAMGDVARGVVEVELKRPDDVVEDGQSADGLGEDDLTKDDLGEDERPDGDDV